MANTVDKVINIALGEEGYLEKATNKYLDDKTKNAGSNNWTKYGRDMHEIYPAVMDLPAPWCDCFVDWCFYKAYGVSNAKGLLGGNFDDYTIASAQLYKNKGAWYTSNPKIGDQIFFKNASGTICHTGLVYKVDSSYVYTIEGNTSSVAGVVANGGCVRRKSYALNYSKIAGYGRPNYDVIKREPYKKKMPVLTTKRPVLKKGMKNLQVQRLQKFLNWYFYNKVVNNMSLDTDKDFGEITRQGVIRFQKDVFPEDSSQWDGKFGARSLAKAKEFTK